MNLRAMVLIPLMLQSLIVLAEEEKSIATRPNILFIMADDLGWVDLSCTGRRFHQTPNIDKLADPRNTQRNPVYAAMVESLDDGVGRVLAALDECGIADRTIIVFFSDNGGISWGGDGSKLLKSARFPADMTDPPTSNLPLRNGKASLYEDGVSVSSSAGPESNCGVGLDRSEDRQQTAPLGFLSWLYSVERSFNWPSFAVSEHERRPFSRADAQHAESSTFVTSPFLLALISL